MQIRRDDLCSAAVVELLREHLADAARQSPPGSVHALDLAGLRGADVTFWCAWDKFELLGFGALKELDAAHGEVKSMRTAAAHLGRGVASAILTQLITEARSRRYSRLSLETGSGKAFEPAHRLYEKFGFRFCGPFAAYKEDPFSRFMTMEL
ncbi:MAG: GNAT family N-acetyltransferase [Gammaproteobacteria bacterium]|nr:GNAT family N-acetyltransferase [Gammaproteobacteria bacterium]MDH5302601.1 GNAT family N-acetyltransferase [Gammaproteobacteria bacterium]MDH5323081.1 GNAT family N-acetyltransferase [Gammaproteobacteria bacterium]